MNVTLSYRGHSGVAYQGQRQTLQLVPYQLQQLQQQLQQQMLTQPPSFGIPSLGAVQPGQVM